MHPSFRRASTARVNTGAGMVLNTSSYGFLPGTDPGGRHGAAAAPLNPGEIPGFPGAGSHTRTHCPQKLRKRAPDAAISRHQACTAGNRAFGFMQRNFNCPFRREAGIANGKFFPRCVIMCGQILRARCFDPAELAAENLFSMKAPPERAVQLWRAARSERRVQMPSVLGNGKRQQNGGSVVSQHPPV